MLYFNMCHAFLHTMPSIWTRLKCLTDTKPTFHGASKVKPAPKGRKGAPVAIKGAPVAKLSLSHSIPPLLTCHLLTSGLWIDAAGSRNIPAGGGDLQDAGRFSGGAPIDFRDVISAAEISSLIEESSPLMAGADVASIVGKHLKP